MSKLANTKAEQDKLVILSFFPHQKSIVDGRGPLESSTYD